ICDIVDITKNKETTYELKRRNSQLEATSANLLNKITQLEELNHIIAHNLRGPAGNIKMLSEGSGIFEHEEALKMIQSASVSLLGHLDMMVEIARIKLDKEIGYDSCHVRGVIAGITQQLHGIIYQRDVRFILTLGVPEIKYPKMYLESILYNLISNAIKYS